MAAYIIRRILWGIVLIMLVSALTFLLFNVLPAANPAPLRAGRDASPRDHRLHHQGARARQADLHQFFDYLKGIILHFNFGYSYLQPSSRSCR